MPLTGLGETGMTKTLTLPEELRSWIEPYKDNGLDALFRKAADEIERLERELAACCDELSDHT